MTFSIAGRCGRTGMLGMAIASSSIAVAGRCCWARAGTGAVLTQNFTDPGIGLRGLELLAQGMSAGETVRRLVEENVFPAYRQIAVVDRDGNVSFHTGEKALPVCASAERENCVAIGNLLTHREVPREMATAFNRSPDRHLADRLMDALQKGLEAGGEINPVKSAGLVVVHRHSWPIVDLRADWHEDPVSILRKMWSEFEPQMNTFLLWALSPDKAPPV